MFFLDDIPLTRPERDMGYLLLVILRWVNCKHPRTYWANGVDGYKCPDCQRIGYSGSAFFDPNFRSN
jgi:hypothetical protein